MYFLAVDSADDGERGSNAAMRDEWWMSSMQRNMLMVWMRVAL